MPQDHFDGALVHIHIGTKEENKILGNAAMVAPGIAIGARHVIESDLPMIIKGERHIWATAVCKGSRLDYWEIRHINTHENTDLAIFSLVRKSELPEDLTLNVTVPSTRMPNEGETVMVAGFHWTGGSSSNQQEHFQSVIHGDVRGAVGLVTDRFAIRRDNSSLRWPCFAIRVGTYGGMSGGPAFDSEGHLIGVLCSGFGDGDSTEGPSYISMLYPALYESFLTAWPNALYPERTTLLEIDRRLCPIVGAEHLTRVLDLNGQLNWHYDQWS